jgi:fumarylpyruvate hydrolase
MAPATSVAIGAPAFRVSRDDAHQAIYGYAAGLDMTRRDLQLVARDKGQVKQKSDVNKLIWNVREIIADLSLFYHLQPGDLVYTGTPEGVGVVVTGDRIEGRVEGIGEIVLNVGPAE